MLEERNAISETPLSASKKLGIIEKHKEAGGGQKDDWLIKVALFAAQIIGKAFQVQFSLDRAQLAEGK